MEIVEKEEGWPLLDTDIPNTFCQLLKLLPGSRVKSPVVEGLAS